MVELQFKEIPPRTPKAAYSVRLVRQAADLEQQPQGAWSSPAASSSGTPPAAACLPSPWPPLQAPPARALVHPSSILPRRAAAPGTLPQGSGAAVSVFDQGGSRESAIWPGRRDDLVMEQGEVMMQSPWLERPAADGTLVEPADVDEMVGMFQSLLHGLDAGEARRHLAEHGWDLQAAIKGAPLIAAALVPFDGAPLWREAPPRAAEPEREGFDKQMRRIAAARAEVDAARATLRRAPRPSVPG